MKDGLPSRIRVIRVHAKVHPKDTNKQHLQSMLTVTTASRAAAA